MLADALAQITQLNFPSSASPDTWTTLSATLWAGAPIDRRNRPRADHEGIVVNSIISLRMLATQNWQEFFESISMVETILRTDPSGIYPRMDFESRNRYRNVIEKLALASPLDKAAIAREALSLAQNGDGSRTRHIGYYLIGPGRLEFEARVGYRADYKNLLYRWLTRDSIAGYLAGILTLTMILGLVAVLYAAYAGGSLLQILLAFALTCLPASAVAVGIINWLVVPPRILPRLNFQDDIPLEFSVMVVIPSLLKYESELDALLHQLESHYLCNSDPNIRFALLTDFVDAPQQEFPGEMDLIQKAMVGIEQLNFRYGGQGHDPFYFFHRERTWNPKEGCWMGWERKRGKLVEFNGLLNGREGSGFSIQSGDMSVLSAIRYVVPLDADTILPRDCARQLAGIMAHPLNQAEFDPEMGALVDGYTVIQPRVQGLTTDRAEFLGPLGNYASPAALDRVGLTASVQAGNDPCAAIQLLLWLAPNESKEVTFLLGQGEDREDALRLIAHYQNMANVQTAWESLRSFWDEQIGNIQIKTPDAGMDLLINRWLPYQVLTCRIWGRTAFYQSGGAYGYRDQLQDVLAFAYIKPEITRQHILKAARHQFEEGDVLHWWHPPADRGVRTRITDNLLWLPYVTAHYIKITGDRSILDEQVPFLSAEPLKDGEHDRYGEFPSGITNTLYEHCCRALSKGTTEGEHGLPLIGGRRLE